MLRLNRSLLLFLMISLAACAAAVADLVDDIVGQVSQTSYQGYLDGNLYAKQGDDREAGTGTEHDLARDFVQSEFDNFGLTTSLDPFTNGNNVVGVHTGTVTPDEIYIIGAHYDSSNSRGAGGGLIEGAPGADDNASGVAGVLEAARVLSQYELESTVIFIAFDREEQGLIGSKHYAAAHSTDDIRSMISLDMIAYSGGDLTRAKLYPGSNSLTTTRGKLADSLLEYSGITATLGGNFDRSDHAPFENFGEGSCLLIEYASNPNYHEWVDAVDTPNYIDYEYATNMTQGVVGYLLDNAGLTLIPEPASAILLIGCTLGLFIVIGRRVSRCR